MATQSPPSLRTPLFYINALNLLTSWTAGHCTSISMIYLCSHPQGLTEWVDEYKNLHCFNNSYFFTSFIVMDLTSQPCILP